ncbi:hypothetical protein L1887_22511 [Cichorium endivia]|nr:hypothetical protein L1887_22511 [Cichorium endivia]
MLGYCSTSSSSNGHLGQQFEQNTSEDRSGCHKVDGLLEQYKDSTKSDSVRLVCGSYICTNKKLGWIRKLHDIHWNEQVVSNLDLHVLIYGTPRFGGHHFSFGTRHSSDQAKTFSRKPKWLEDLDQKKPVLDLDTVILPTNCATVATSLFEEQVSPHRPAIFYILHFLLSYGSDSFLPLQNLFTHTSRNIRVRCCQILYCQSSFTTMILGPDHVWSMQKRLHYAIINMLTHEFTSSNQTSHRKGGLIGLAAITVGLSAEVAQHLEIFDALCKLSADSDANVQSAAHLLDRLVKDIVTENNQFRERMNLLNPYVCQFLVGWITVLDNVPDIDMLGFLPDILDGLFNMLSDSSHEIRQQADSALSEFLQEIKNSPVRLLYKYDIIS